MRGVAVGVGGDTIGTGNSDLKAATDGEMPARGLEAGRGIVLASCGSLSGAVDCRRCRAAFSCHHSRSASLHSRKYEFAGSSFGGELSSMSLGQTRSRSTRGHVPPPLGADPTEW